mgnify:CR=1 FL=1
MFYVAIYLGAIVLANLLITAFGPDAVIPVAFLLIGLDLTARDQLHEAWRNDNLVLKMGALIAVGSILSWLLNRNAGPVAVASFVAFAATATVDALVYHRLGNYPRWLRINGSNVPSAAVDSLLFIRLAFGTFLWPQIVGQFLAKTLGGLLWSLLFRWLDRRAAARRRDEAAPGSGADPTEIEEIHA